MTEVLILRTMGFSKLRHGRIHLRCPMCGRKMSNARRYAGDPDEAFLVEIPCDKHPGLKDPTPDYFDSSGDPIEAPYD